VNEKSGLQELMDLIHGPAANSEVAVEQVKGIAMEA
jgi:hypothetical protein